MKKTSFSIVRSDLVRALSECKAAGRNSVAKIFAHQDGLWVQSDNELLVYSWIVPCSVDGDALPMCVSPGAVLAFLGQCKDDQVDGTITESAVSVKCGSSSAKFVASVNDIYQYDKPSTTIRIKDLAIFDGLHAASRSATRNNQCVLRLVDGKAITTDGHRLAVVDIEDPDIDMTIPVHLAEKGAARVRAKADIAYGQVGSMCCLVSRGETWMFPLPESAFPPCDDLLKLVDSKKDTGIEVGCIALRDAIKSALSCSDGGGICITAGECRLVVSSDSSIGSAMAETSCGPGEVEFSVQAKYILDAISGNDTVTIASDSPLDTIVITGGCRADLIAPLQS